MLAGSLFSRRISFDGIIRYDEVYRNEDMHDRW